MKIIPKHQELLDEYMRIENLGEGISPFGNDKKTLFRGFLLKLHLLDLSKKHNALFASYMLRRSRSLPKYVLELSVQKRAPEMPVVARFYTELRVHDWVDTSFSLAGWEHIEALHLCKCEMLQEIKFTPGNQLYRFGLTCYNGGVVDITPLTNLTELSLYQVKSRFVIPLHNNIKTAKVHSCYYPQGWIRSLPQVESLVFCFDTLKTGEHRMAIDLSSLSKLRELKTEKEDLPFLKGIPKNVKVVIL